MSVKFFLPVIAATLLATPVLAGPVLFENDFEGVDPSTAFEIGESDAASSVIDYSFIYTDHVNATGEGRSYRARSYSAGTSEKGLFVQVNNGAVGAFGSNVYPVLPSALPDDYNLTFDLWYNHATDNTTTTTEFVQFGAGNDASFRSYAPEGTNGFVFSITGEGGSGTDARFALGSGALAGDNTLPGWDVSTSLGNWPTWIPQDADRVEHTPGFFRFTWNTIEVRVRRSGSVDSVTIALTNINGDTATISSPIDIDGISADRPFVGLFDGFSGSDGGVDTFIVVDNVVITDETQTGAHSWGVYE